MNRSIAAWVAAAGVVVAAGGLIVLVETEPDRTAEAPEAAPSTEQAQVRRLVQELGSRSAATRRAAATKLGAMHRSKYIGRAVEPLIAALGDGETWRVRLPAARALRLIGDRRAVRPLLERLREDEHTAVRVAAARALGALGDPAASDALARVARNDTLDEALRLSAIEALGTLGGAPAAPALIEAMKDEADLVRRAAAASLGALEAVRAVDPLIERLSDADPLVVEAAAGALAAIGDERAFEPLVGLLERDVARVRWAGAGALGVLGDPRGRKPLEKAATGDPNPHVRAGAVAALGRLGDEASLPTLARALRYRNPEDPKDMKVPRSSAAAIGRIPSERSVELLIDALTLPDRSHSLHQAAAEALEAIGPDLAMPPLLERLRSGDARQQYIAARAIAIGPKSPEATEPLIGLLDSPNERVRAQAAEALAKIAPPEAADALVYALGDEHWKVQANAADALAAIRPDQAVEPLTTLLRSRRRQVVFAAAHALGEIGDPAAVEPLSKLLKSREKADKLAAAAALGRMGPVAVDATDELLAVIREVKAGGHRPTVAYRLVIGTDVVLAAIKALGEVGDARALDPLRTMAREGHPDVAGQAGEALNRILIRRQGS